MNTSIYALLGFNSSDPIANSGVSQLSSNVITQMEMMPALVNSWQQQDIANQSTSGYYQNPLASGIQITLNSANTILANAASNGGSSSTITNTLIYISRTASNLVSGSNGTGNICANFLDHTNRMSNMVGLDQRTYLPHYQISIGYGKIMMYLTNQSDGIQNNSPMIGSFTSILAANLINSNANTLLVLAQQYANSVNTGGYSNLTLTQVNTMNSVIQFLATEMVNLRANDITFYTNTQNVMSAYNAVTQFSNMGQSELSLVTNYIGTPKIVTRLTTGNTS